MNQAEYDSVVANMRMTVGHPGPAVARVGLATALLTSGGGNLLCCGCSGAVAGQVVELSCCQGAAARLTSHPACTLSTPISPGWGWVGEGSAAWSLTA